MSKRNKFARIGMATKGLVYLLLGGLTAFSAFGWGGEKAGSSAAIDFLSNRIFGQVLLVVTAIGLLGYLFFRWRESFNGDFEDKYKAVAIVTRIAYFGSGLFYGLLALSALKSVIGMQSSDKSSFGLTDLLNSEYGLYIAIVIGVIVTVKAGYEFYRAFSGSFKEKVSKAELSKSEHNKVLKAGLVGHTARGVVFGILAFLFYKAAFSRSRDGMGQEEAFSFIEDTFGWVILAVIALGVVIYGVFMMISARYSAIE